MPLNSSGIREITYAIVSGRPVCFSPAAYNQLHNIILCVNAYQCLRDGIGVPGRRIAHSPSKAPAPRLLAFVYRSPLLCRLSPLVEQRWAPIGYNPCVKSSWLKSQGEHIPE